MLLKFFSNFFQWRDNIFKLLLKVFSYNFFSKVKITKVSLNDFVKIYLKNHLDSVLIKV